jgi:hypothetical protein
MAGKWKCPGHKNSTQKRCDECGMVETHEMDDYCLSSAPNCPECVPVDREAKGYMLRVMLDRGSNGR